MTGHLSFKELRKDDPAGAAEIERLARVIWSEHYTALIGGEQVAYMLDHLQSAVAVAAQIKEGYRYFFIEQGEERVGYFAVKLQPSDLKGRNEMFLSKLYVLSSRRGFGIGREAMVYIQVLAREVGATQVTLMVNKGNLSSIRFYEQQGFVNRGPIIKDIGGGFVMDDFLYVKTLAG
jgi:ribosomal protein S18 acetylase RimI-like enzyme